VVFQHLVWIYIFRCESIFVKAYASQQNYYPGQTGSVTIVIENNGTNTWYSDSNLPPGQQPTRLAVNNYRNSEFIYPDANSLNTQNQILMTPSVVSPGQTATFTFEVKAPYRLLSDTINLVPINGGIFLKNIGMNATLTSNPPLWQLSSAYIGTQNPLPNQITQATFKVINTSNNDWYSDSNLPPGQQPTRLATINYQKTIYADTSDPNWLNTQNQILMTPSVVSPGQTATFSAQFIGPISQSAVSSLFHFSIIVGGVFGKDLGSNFTLSTPSSNLGYSYVSSSSYPSIATMSPREKSMIFLSIKNNGNVVWNDGSIDNGNHSLRLMMNNPIYRNSLFYDSSSLLWVAPSQIQIPNNGAIYPGQIATFQVPWTAPSILGSYKETFQPIIGGILMEDKGMIFGTDVRN